MAKNGNLGITGMLLDYFATGSINFGKLEVFQEVFVIIIMKF